MNRIDSIKSIQIYFNNFVDMEITRDNEVEVFSFAYEDKDKYKALSEFIRVFKLRDKTEFNI